MRGVGGPLLCIGDLLSDVGEGNGGDREATTDAKFSPSSSSSLVPDSNLNLHPSDLTKLFQESYNKLNEALAGTDHSWTTLTLKLCTALETASKLMKSTENNASLLSEKVVELENIMKRGDSAVAAAKALHKSLNLKGGPVISENTSREH